MNTFDGTALTQIRERVLTANRTGTPLRLRAGGTKDFYGADFVGDVLDLAGHRGIVDYEPSELVITARSGTPLSEIEATLAERDQFLAFEPPYFDGQPTLGGAIAAGLSGPRRMQVGAARDFVLGARLLNADAEELRFGGSVMKNVAGFDVSRALCGSLGILGIITQVSLKVLPRPRCEETLQLELPATEAIALFNRWGSLPLPISAATWVNGRAWVRLSGAVPAVTTAKQRIGGELVAATAAASFWNSLRHCKHAFFQQTPLWRLSVSSRAPVTGNPEHLLIDWGGALRWYSSGQPAAEIRSVATAAGGTAMRWTGAGPESRFHPLSAVTADIHRRLKERFDPRGIFNRDRLIRGL